MAISRTTNKHLFGVIIGLVVALVFLVYVAYQVRPNTGSTVTHASRDVILTPGDDALSLQQDLISLEKDPGMDDEWQLNNLR
jgi:hypothetical protein